MVANTQANGSILDLLANGQDAIFGVDLQHRIVIWNRQAQRLLGWTDEEMLGRLCFECIGVNPHQECGPHCRVMLVARMGQVPSGQTLHVRTKEDQEKWLYAAHMLLPSARPELAVLVHILRDATTQVEAQQLLGHLGKFFQRLPLSSPAMEQADQPHEADGLSRREREVLTLLAQGQSAPEIARLLSISPATVRNHIQRILAKLNLHTRADAVGYAFRHGLL